MKNSVRGFIWIAPLIILGFLIVGGIIYLARPGSFVLGPGDINWSPSTASTIVDQSSLADIDTSGIFKKDGSHVYFADSEHVAGAPIYQVATKVSVIGDADLASFVTDKTWWDDSINATTVEAHDKSHSYVAQQVRTSCGGDKTGCIVSTKLTISGR